MQDQNIEKPNEKAEYSKYMKDYREKNKEKLTARENTLILCEHCNKQVKRYRLAGHNKTKKTYCKCK